MFSKLYNQIQTKFSKNTDKNSKPIAQKFCNIEDILNSIFTIKRISKFTVEHCNKQECNLWGLCLDYNQMMKMPINWIDSKSILLYQKYFTLNSPFYVKLNWEGDEEFLKVFVISMFAREECINIEIVAPRQSCEISKEPVLSMDKLNLLFQKVKYYTEKNVLSVYKNWLFERYSGNKPQKK